jgi:hypothetical protein
MPAMLASGSSIRTMCWTWVLSAWPAPTTDFLMWLAPYSATRRPANAGTSSTTPRARPSFRVEVGFLLTKVSSTAASSGVQLRITSTSPSCSCTSRVARAALSSESTRPSAM